MEFSKVKLNLIRTLLSFIIIFYFTFLYMDLFKIQASISSDTIKFLSMLLVLFICLLIGENRRSNRDTYLLQIGISITVLADIFLLLLNKNYILGVGLFCLVQILYSIRYNPKYAKITIGNFILLFTLLILIYVLIDNLIIKIDFLSILAVYYAICLLTATNKAINLYKNKSYPRSNEKMIALGMILFLLCDINVALFNISKSIAISNSYVKLLASIIPLSIWLFYLPSQVLLALSGYNRKYLKNIFLKI